MFEALRIERGLTRQELAQLTGRSPNYILKAEQLTFPSPPVALLDFYKNDEKAGFDGDTTIIEEAYRAAQKAKREQWLDYYVPITTNEYSSFCRAWKAKLGEGVVREHPTEYRVSQGLCVPAPAVYRAEKYGHISEPIKTALRDLVDYGLSGRYSASVGVYPGAANNTVEDLLSLVKHFGVVL